MAHPLSEYIGSNIRKAAKELGVSRQHIYRVLAGAQKPEKLLKKLVAAKKLPEAQLAELNTKLAAEAVRAREAALRSKMEARQSEAATENPEDKRLLLRTFRNRRGFTLNELAILTGVPLSNLWNYEHRNISMTTATAAKIALALSLIPKEIDELFEHQQSVAPTASQTGSSAWERGLFAGLCKLGIRPDKQDWFSGVTKLGRQLPLTVRKNLRKELLRRSRMLKSDRLCSGAVDGVIRHKVGAASVIVLCVVKVETNTDENFPAPADPHAA